MASQEARAPRRSWRAASSDPALDRFIATRMERQEFWTEIMFAKNEETLTRLKASELLGRSECDFVDRRIVTWAGWRLTASNRLI